MGQTLALLRLAFSGCATTMSSARSAKLETDAQPALAALQAARVDVAGVHWLRAMVSFQRAALALVSSWEPDLSGLRHNRLDVLRLTLRNPEKPKQARALILAGLEHARLCQFDRGEDTFERKLRYLFWLN